MKIKYSVVVPVYNSEESLPSLCKRLSKVFKKMKQSYEIILVDDFSKDNSWNVMKQLSKKNKKIQIIQLRKNFGQNNASMCGFNYARGNFIVTLDDDLQQAPEDIPKLISKLKQGYDAVFGVYRGKKHNILRNVASKIIRYWFTKSAGISFRLTSFRVIRREIIDEIIKFDNHAININILLSNITTKIGSCFVKHYDRKYGKTNYNIVRLARWAINMVFNFTVFPLRLATMLGVFFSGLSILLGIYYGVQYYFNNIEVSGFTSLILSISFFSGVTLFVLGIIGEYVGKIFLTINKKPQYIVRDKK